MLPFLSQGSPPRRLIAPHPPQHGRLNGLGLPRELTWGGDGASPPGGVGACRSPVQRRVSSLRHVASLGLMLFIFKWEDGEAYLVGLVLNINKRSR